MYGLLTTYYRNLFRVSYLAQQSRLCIFFDSKEQSQHVRRLKILDNGVIYCAPFLRSKAYLSNQSLLALNTPYFIARRLLKALPKRPTEIVYRVGIVSISLGLTTTIVAFSVLQGFYKNVEQKLTHFSGHVQITKHAWHRLAHEESTIDKNEQQELHQALPDTVKITKAFANKALLIKSSKEFEGVVSKGLDPETTHNNLNIYLTTGQLIDFACQHYSKDIILSNQTADRLHVRVGDEVIAYTIQQPTRCRKLRVAGLYSTQISEIDSNLAFCDLRLVQRLNNWPCDMVGGYDIFLNDLQQLASFVDQLATKLDHDWSIQPITNEYAAIFDWLTIIRKNAFIFMALILLVVCSNLASVVLIQTVEHTPIMGLLKTLGASGKQLRRVMLYYHLHMVQRGMIWGNILGIGLCTAQKYGQLISLDPTYYYTPHVPIAWTWPTIVYLNLSILTVVIIALSLSIATITRLQPIRTIRFR